MQAVIDSKEGTAALMEAIKAGNPPLCGVVALLTAIIIGYGAKDDQILRSAGSLVAETMGSMGLALICAHPRSSVFPLLSDNRRRPRPIEQVWKRG